MVKTVPGFLQVPDLWRWVISNAVALFSGLQSAHNEHSMHHPMIHPAADSIRLLTGIGLDFLAGMLSGLTVDRAMLQL
eukprot:4752104-Amphidinium_carterae.1